MSSIKSFFNYDDFEYEPTVDSKFIDNLFLLIQKGNVKKVKEFISTVLADSENENLLIETEDYNNDYSTVRIDSPFTADDYNVEVDYYGDEYDGSQDLSKQNKLLEITFSNGYTPLMLAAQKGFPELVEYFIALNFDVNKAITKTGLTALLAASSSTSEDFENVTKCIRLLIDAGANQGDSLTKNNQSALHLAALANNVVACEYLADFMDVNIKNASNCTPIMVAASVGFIDIVNVFLKHGSDLSVRNVHGLSAVELAIVCDHQDIVRLLIRPTDNLDFYGAWCAVLKDLNETEKKQKIGESFVKKFYSSKYFSDPIACMCASLNLTHLQPILEKHGVTFAQLRSMSDIDMKNIGIAKFSDRKCLLNLMQDVHKVGWTHVTSIYTPNYKSSITPLDMLDVVKNAHEHLEFMESSIEYMGNHLLTNTSYYANYSQHRSFFDKCAGHCQFVTYRAKNVYDNIVKINGLFDKMYRYALDEDKSSQINDEAERLEQLRLTRKYSNAWKAGLIVSGITVVGMVFVRARLLNM